MRALVVRPRIPAVLCGMVLLIALEGPALAQAGGCNIIRSENVVGRTVAGDHVFDVAGPLLVRCADGEELRADSAVLYEGRGLVELYRDVSFRDRERDVRSERGTYRSETGHVRMTGNVVYRDLARNTVLRGPELDYFREMPGREDPRVIAAGRPRLVTRDEDPVEPDSTIIDADRITTVGETLLSASGDVVIRRPDLTARSRTARFETGRGLLDLVGNASLEGEAFRLSGDDISAELPEERLRSVTARGTARLEGEDLTVTGQLIDLHFERDLLQRLVSRGDPDGMMATAESESMHLEADSIDARLPDQQLDEVFAVGRALALHRDALDGTATPSIELRDGRSLPTDQDWIRGDTVWAAFVPVDRRAADTLGIGDAPPLDAPTVDPPPGENDGDSSVELRRLVAAGSAGALFRARDDDAPAGAPPSLSYVTGARIEMEMDEGEMHLATVEGLRRGIHLDASGRPPAADPSPQEDVAEEADPLVDDPDPGSPPDDRDG